MLMQEGGVGTQLVSLGEKLKSSRLCLLRVVTKCMSENPEDPAVGTGK